MAPLVLLTHSPEYSALKRFLFAAKMFLKRRLRYGGPVAVQDSLLKGLNELGIPFLFNPEVSSIKPNSVVGVLTDVTALKWAVKAKKNGHIAKILAGPNLVITPLEEGGILTDPSIDIVITPGKWVKDFYISVSPQLAGRVEAWPAGVDIPNKQEQEKKYDVLIYNKLKSGSLAQEIKSYLTNQGKKFINLNYGGFSQKDYFKLLGESKLLVYLSESESQGIAMFEAWARGVPSLVWERGLFTYGKYSVPVKAASEYVSKEVGLPFFSLEDFERQYKQLEQASLDPRGFVLENYSNRRAAENYLKIVGA